MGAELNSNRSNDQITLTFAKTAFTNGSTDACGAAAGAWVEAGTGAAAAGKLLTEGETGGGTSFTAEFD